MSDTTPSDSHDSASLARPVSTASVDGWDVESSSAIQPSNDELAARLRDEPAPAGDEPDADETVESEARPAAVDEDHDDSPASETGESRPDPARNPDGTFTKKKKLTASERKAVLQAEFNALTKQREDARRAFEAEEAERATARAAKSETTPAVPDPAPASGEPDWDAYEEAGKTFSQFQKDHAAWLRKVITAEADARATRTADERISAERERAFAIAEVARQEGRLDAVKVKYPDFDEVVSTNLSDVPQTPFMAAVVRNHPAGFDLLYHLGQHPAEAKILATLPMTRPIMDAVKESADPVGLLSYFANHPEDHDRIAHLDPPRQLLALGRLSAELSGSGAKNGSPGPTPPVTTAKPPIRPLGTTRSAPVSRDDDDLEFGPAYIKRENERRLAAHAAR